MWYGATMLKSGRGGENNWTVGCDGQSSPAATRVQAMLEKAPDLVACVADGKKSTGVQGEQGGIQLRGGSKGKLKALLEEALRATTRRAPVGAVNVVLNVDLT
jgi:hypothetical protein